MSLAWNQKYLDYEIETWKEFHDGNRKGNVEIRSISITRLKRAMYILVDAPNTLEIRSISITRLKLQSRSLMMLIHLRMTIAWNQKYLDYEIETSVKGAILVTTFSPWNQKYLDYEIETWTYPFGWYWNLYILEIRSISITRLKREVADAITILLPLEIRSISITRLKLES